MRFLSSIGGGTKAAFDGGAVRRTIPQGNFALGRPYTPPTRASNVQRFVQDTYERVPGVRVAVDAVARSAARLKIVVKQSDPVDGTEIENHPLLDLLNQVANPLTGMTAYNFRFMLSQQLMLSPKGVFIEVVRDRRGDPYSLGLIPPDTIWPVPDANTFTAGYDVRVGQGAETVHLPNDRVLWIRNPHPLDPFRSMTPLEACGVSIDIDWHAHVYNLRFLRTDGRPAALIAAKNGMIEEDAEELQAWFMGGPDRAGTTRVIEADGLDYVDLTTNPRDAQYQETLKTSLDEILMACGVPKSVAGDASGRTWDNAEVEQLVFWQETMLPHLELVGGAFDTLDGDPTTFVVHDTTKVDALQRAKNEDLKNKREEVQAGVRSIDSYLEAAGEEPYEVPETMVPLTSVGVGPLFTVSTGGDYVEEPPPPPPPVPGENQPPANADNVPAPTTNGNAPVPA